jgi:DNA-directed RNA polymerase subunit RPC12/RpoP
MKDYLDPEGELLGKVMRRGGPMDTMRRIFICEQCGQEVVFKARQAASGRKPACSHCGPTAPLRFSRDDIAGESSSNAQFLYAV